MDPLGPGLLRYRLNRFATKLPKSTDGQLQRSPAAQEPSGTASLMRASVRCGENVFVSRSTPNSREQFVGIRRKLPKLRTRSSLPVHSTRGL